MPKLRFIKKGIRMNRLTSTALLALSLFAFVLFAGGCQSELKSSDLRSNWTPELKSLTQSDEQYANFRSRHRHNNWRQAYDDWAMIWLEDRNMKMTDYIIP